MLDRNDDEVGSSNSIVYLTSTNDIDGQEVTKEE